MRTSHHDCNNHGGTVKSKFKLAIGAAAIAIALQASAEVTFFENDGFSGRSFTADKQVGNFERFGFNDRASSVVVRRGNWEICSNAGFQGQCVVLRPGSYGSLAAMGLNDAVSSVRPASGDAGPGPGFASPTGYDYRKRHGERTYEAPVTYVHAVVGPPQQRCWVERQQVASGGSPDINVPGAIIGGVIGGVLGHQVGGGRGQDIATGVGAVGGAAVGANVGRGGQVYSQDVQRCDYAPTSGRPDYWDVSYNFRGYEHRVQMTTPPGSTILVNEKGEPRV